MPDPSTPAGIKAARNQLGLSATQMAAALGVPRYRIAITRRGYLYWEAGTHPISGPVENAVKFMLRRAARRVPPGRSAVS